MFTWVIKKRRTSSLPRVLQTHWSQAKWPLTLCSNHCGLVAIKTLILGIDWDSHWTTAVAKLFLSNGLVVTYTHIVVAIHRMIAHDFCRPCRVVWSKKRTNGFFVLIGLTGCYINWWWWSRLINKLGCPFLIRIF